ncbi:DUF5009 domain-containing protein [Chitinophaga horti]|uniref:DUF5009 domain-containing protein n=1 Tax=Chitinophaga horti TaxID=2920382 RepID=A0ABY6IX02_9BACT|nr:DUF5009 domain-containing protein [Chitinophaga horti]UYQ91910.1 DUF5009 domain-containing protein [Chitinophaga horti]
MTEQIVPRRILSIDALRGITILVMIFVNELAGIRDIPQWAKHLPADANGMTFVDMVFPAFLFIVGMSVPFAIRNRVAKGDSLWQILLHIGFRTLGLLVLGLFMVNAETDYNPVATGMPAAAWSLLFYACVILVWNVYRFKYAWLLRALGAIGLLALAVVFRGGEDAHGMQVHWWGILGLIGWAYLFTSLFYLVVRGQKTGIAAAILGCLVFFVAGKEWESWLSGQTGHAVHTCIALCGLFLSQVFFDGRTGRPYLVAAIFTLVLLVVGSVLRPAYTISKIWATPSWALYSAASCCILYTIVYWLTDVKGHNGWTTFLRPAAANPLLTYILPAIIYSLLSLAGFQLLPDAWRTGLPGALYCVLFALAVMGVVKLLNRAGIRLQL